VALFEPLFEALNRGDVRYVVVGGVAVVLHGFARLTGDVDLAIDLRPAEARKAVTALLALGLRPRLPVDPFDFADPVARGSWVREKGMRVFTFLDPANPLLLVDCFAEDVVPFDELWARSELMTLASTAVRVASIPDLIALKRRAGAGRGTRRTSRCSRRLRGGAEARVPEDPAWDAGWEGARRFQVERALAATPAERLAWLEQAIELAHRSGALPAPLGPDGGRSDEGDRRE
jgi:hypothetical protein